MGCYLLIEFVLADGRDGGSDRLSHPPVGCAFGLSSTFDRLAADRTEGYYQNVCAFALDALAAIRPSSLPHPLARFAPSSRNAVCPPVFESIFFNLPSFAGRFMPRNNLASATNRNFPFAIPSPTESTDRKAARLFTHTPSARHAFSKSRYLRSKFSSSSRKPTAYGGAAAAISAPAIGDDDG